MRRLLGLVASLALAIATLTALTSSTTATAAFDKNCSDFNTQAAAQSYFINNGGPDNDPDGLDADGDGIACESNPCPCSTNQGAEAAAEEERRPATPRE